MPDADTWGLILKEAGRARGRCSSLKVVDPEPARTRHGRMKTKIAVLTLFLSLAAGTLCSASTSMVMGKWVLNEGKSKFAPGSPHNKTVVYSAAGDRTKVTVDGVDKDGKKTHNEWTGKFDGKEYPLTGDPTADMRSYKQVNAHTLDLTNKKAGKVVMTGRIFISADGKTRMVTTHPAGARDKKSDSIATYDKR